jgi:hypothetical protein
VRTTVDTAAQLLQGRRFQLAESERLTIHARHQFATVDGDIVANMAWGFLGKAG